MSKVQQKISTKVGLPPGTLVHVGQKKKDKAKISIIEYNESGVEEREITNIKERLPEKDKSYVTWINIDGLHNLEMIEEVGQHFGIHPLVLEDIVNTGQRPKMEDYENYLYLVLKMIYLDDDNDTILTEQISLILNDRCLISFQESEADVFNPIRERIRSGKGRIRKMGVDYLAYALVDAIVDNYFVVLEKVDEQLELVEQELEGDPTPDTLQSIHSLKKDMIYLRKSVWPLREVIGALDKGESDLILKPTRIYLKDVYDHTLQVTDSIESTRDMLSGMLDTYLSSVSNRMNEVMKVLTIIATIFIPLTFIAGIYGMNFRYMPELSWKLGYFAVLLLMLVIALLMLLYFKRKRWL